VMKVLVVVSRSLYLTCHQTELLALFTLFSIYCLINFSVYMFG
jgi:hypothetical protein